MANVFGPRANLIARGTLVAVGGALLFITLVGYACTRSPFATLVGVEIDQPIPFSHQHHVGGLGIDCRYCHTEVENSATAGMPPTQTCMHCHSKLWTDAPLLEPLRESWRTGRPIPWRRVHDLPDYVYFDHSIHVRKGIGCSTCHGRVDQMRLERKAETLFMGWCINCHREPGRFVRTADEVFSMTWQPPRRGPSHDELRDRHGIITDGLTNCSTCHR